MSAYLKPLRICFQIEQAHWFYEDFIREEHPSYPSYSLKHFSSLFFASCPLLQSFDPNYAYSKFMEYKTRVPVCGGILLNEKCKTRWNDWLTMGLSNYLTTYYSIPHSTYGFSYKSGSCSWLEIKNIVIPKVSLVFILRGKIDQGESELHWYCFLFIPVLFVKYWKKLGLILLSCWMKKITLKESLKDNELDCTLYK